MDRTFGVAIGGTFGSSQPPDCSLGRAQLHRRVDVEATFQNGCGNIQ